MLARLHIENIALIDRLDLELLAGFNVLTGETGAGKSIIIDSVNLVLGERADRELIKSGQEKARVEALFELPKALLEARFSDFDIDPEEEQLILSRELSINGKNVCRINGRLSSLAALKEIADSLVDIHGQHEHQQLFKASSHLLFLDAYGGRALLNQKEIVGKAYHNWRKLKKRLATEIGSEAERARKIDQLQFQIDEIEKAQLQEGEEEVLNEERALLADSERVQSVLTAAIQEINGDEEQDGAAQRIKSAAKGMENLVALSANFELIKTRLEECYYALEDVGFELSHLNDDAAYDPYRYEEVEQRLEVIENLKRKYGENIEEILAFAANAQNELDDILAMQELAEKGEEELESLSLIVYEESEKLHEIRIKTAKKLEKALLAELADLGMEKAKFSVRFESFPKYKKDMEYAASGLDSLEMLLTTNPGEPLKPLRKVASGGEMSRIMLAFKSIAANQDDNITMIFDEIDTGISGRVSVVVGEKMRAIAKDHQVICVTHSPQIAAMADAHFLIEKHEEKGKTKTSVRLLDDAGHVEEVARIAGTSEQSEHTLAYARELVENSRRKE